VEALPHQYRRLEDDPLRTGNQWRVSRTGGCGRDVEPQIADGLPHSALTGGAGDRLRQHQPERNCSSPVCRQ